MPSVSPVKLVRLVSLQYPAAVARFRVLKYKNRFRIGFLKIVPSLGRRS